MPLMFNTLLIDAGIDPREVRLLRHQTEKSRELSPFKLWSDRPEAFEQGYQCTQARKDRAYFASKYWASFVSPAKGETLFVGLFLVELEGAIPRDWIDPITGTYPGREKETEYELYKCERIEALAQQRGTLKVDWGSGTRSWRQKAGNQNKEILEMIQPNDIAEKVDSAKAVAKIEADELASDPVRKERISDYIERGPVGAMVKEAREGRCQICEALGAKPIAFIKRDGTAYAEAHHVFPVSKLKAGSLAAQNIMVVCPNHHREIHYGDTDIIEYRSDGWLIRLGENHLEISKTVL
jgi:hypothetical protein